MPFRPLDPLDFAKNYMKLTVRYENLSYGRRVILGCIAYENTVLEINPGDPKSYIPIAERTVFLDESLKKDKQRGRRNFTLAHECSHQAIYLLNPEAYGRCQCRTPGERYSLRELTTENDWFEWQANALAAELLMPVHLVTKVMSNLGYHGKVPIYPDDKLLYQERCLLRRAADYLGVSKAALLIRFKRDHIGHPSEGSVSDPFLLKVSYCSCYARISAGCVYARFAPCPGDKTQAGGIALSCDHTHRYRDLLTVTIAIAASSTGLPLSHRPTALLTIDGFGADRYSRWYYILPHCEDSNGPSDSKP